MSCRAHKHTSLSLDCLCFFLFSMEIGWMYLNLCLMCVCVCIYAHSKSMQWVHAIQVIKNSIKNSIDLFHVDINYENVAQCYVAVYSLLSSLKVSIPIQAKLTWSNSVFFICHLHLYKLKAKLANTTATTAAAAVAQNEKKSATHLHFIHKNHKTKRNDTKTQPF